jgi:hypothetical protein
MMPSLTVPLPQFHLLNLLSRFHLPFLTHSLPHLIHAATKRINGELHLPKHGLQDEQYGNSTLHIKGDNH